MAKKWKPTLPQQYQGNQVIINSDRLVFNSKKDYILCFADKGMAFSTRGAIHFDTNANDTTNSEFVVNAHKIILGFKPGGGSGGQRPDMKGDTGMEAQPALLGRETTDFLMDLIDAIDQVLLELSSNANMTDKGDPIQAGLANNLYKNVKVKYLDELRKALETKSIHSKRLYIQ